MLRKQLNDRSLESYLSDSGGFMIEEERASSEDIARTRDRMLKVQRELEELRLSINAKTAHLEVLQKEGLEDQASPEKNPNTQMRISDTPRFSEFARDSGEAERIEAIIANLKDYEVKKERIEQQLQVNTSRLKEVRSNLARIDSELTTKVLPVAQSLQEEITKQEGELSERRTNLEDLSYQLRIQESEQRESRNQKGRSNSVPRTVNATP